METAGGSRLSTCPSTQGHAGPGRAVSSAPGAMLALHELLKHPSYAYQRASTSFGADQLITPHSGSGWPFPGLQYLYQGPLAYWSWPGKQGFVLRVISSAPMGCPAKHHPPPPRWHLPTRHLRRAAGCAPATLLTSAEGMLLPLLHAAQKSRQKAGVQLLLVRKRNNLVSKSGLSTRARHWKGASRLKGG